MGGVLGGTGYGAGSGMGLEDMHDHVAHSMSSLLAVELTVRRKVGTVAGTPEAGHQTRPSFQNILIRAYLYSLTTEDTHRPGGFYEYGDIIIGLEEFAVQALGGEIRGEQSETGREADRVVWKDLEYRIVGRVDFAPIGPTTVVRQVLCRKVGLPQS
jgi:hypothetical protein